MIKIDPLYILLLAEIACILAAGIVMLYLKMRKQRIEHRDALKSLAEAKQQGEELKRKLSVGQLMGNSEDAAKKTASKKGEEELERLRTMLQEREAQLKEKNGKVEQLEAKLAGLEKEYLVLYQQQQKQQEQPDIP